MLSLQILTCGGNGPTSEGKNRVFLFEDLEALRRFEARGLAEEKAQAETPAVSVQWLLEGIQKWSVLPLEPYALSRTARQEPTLERSARRSREGKKPFVKAPPPGKGEPASETRRSDVTATEAEASSTRNSRRKKRLKKGLARPEGDAPGEGGREDRGTQPRTDTRAASDAALSVAHGEDARETGPVGLQIARMENAPRVGRFACQGGTLPAGQDEDGLWQESSLDAPSTPESLERLLESQQRELLAAYASSQTSAAGEEGEDGGREDAETDTAEDILRAEEEKGCDAKATPGVPREKKASLSE